MFKPRHVYNVYILTNKKDGVLYIGVTSWLENRMLQHKTGYYQGFTKKYKLNKLIYFETYRFVYDAIAREKQLKNWHRAWKIALIESEIPDWVDLADEWFDSESSSE